MKPSASTRRDFLKSSASVTTALSFPYFYSVSPTRADEPRSPNDRIPIGLIGAGGMGVGNMHSARQWFDVVAVADVDEARRENANSALSQGKADIYNDYRAIIDRDDIPVVHIATPDQWHTKPLVEAMLCGKDVYCEKPLTLTIDEGKLIRKIQEQTGRIVQIGTQQRSTFNLFVKAIAMVEEGRLGKIRRMQAAIGTGPRCDAIPVAEVPRGLDWDRWLGPAPKVEYRYHVADGRPHTNCHGQFRWWYEYSGGKLTDWGAHHVDIACWALRANGQLDAPLSIAGTAEHPVEFQAGMPKQTDRYNTATRFRFTVKFPDDVELVIRDDTDNGVLIEGDQGRIFVNRSKLTGAPVEALAEDPLPEDAIQKAYKGLPMTGNERQAHWANFRHCVQAQQEPISDVGSHVKMLNICHLAGISARLARSLTWDDENEQIVGDEEANRFLSRPYRAGYEIEMT